MVVEIITPENEGRVVELARNATGRKISKISKISSDFRSSTNDDTLDPLDPSVSVTKHRGGYRLGGWLPALGGGPPTDQTDPDPSL